MATAVNEIAANAYEVRVWGMDLNEKPFIQSATARQVTERGVLLDGVLPVKAGDTIGVQFQKQKARFKVLTVAQEESSMRRHVGVECVDPTVMWAFPFTIPIEKVTAAAQYAKKNSAAHLNDTAIDLPPNRRSCDRFPCKLAAEVRAVDSITQLYASVTDISRFGCYLEVLTPLAVGSKVNVSIHAADLGFATAFVVPGVVRTSHAMVGMGVEFSNVPEVDGRNLKLLTERLHDAALRHPRQAVTGPRPVESGPTQNSAASGSHTKSELARRAAMDLQHLEMSLNSADLDAQLLQEFRDAATHARHLLALVQQWFDLKEKNANPAIVLPVVTAERLRAAVSMNRKVTSDVDLSEVTQLTPGYRELCAQVAELHGRLVGGTKH